MRAMHKILVECGKGGVGAVCFSTRLAPRLLVYTTTGPKKQKALREDNTPAKPHEKAQQEGPRPSKTA